MLPCNGCAYRDEIPGDAHIKCLYAWGKSNHKPPVNQSDNPRVQRWFIFPFNYDPVWGPNDCPAKSDTRDGEFTAAKGPLSDLLSLLGGRL